MEAEGSEEFGGLVALGDVEVVGGDEADAGPLPGDLPLVPESVRHRQLVRHPQRVLPERRPTPRPSHHTSSPSNGQGYPLEGYLWWARASKLPLSSKVRVMTWLGPKLIVSEAWDSQITRSFPLT